MSTEEFEKAKAAIVVADFGGTMDGRGYGYEGTAAEAGGAIFRSDERGNGDSV